MFGKRGEKEMNQTVICSIFLMIGLSFGTTHQAVVAQSKPKGTEEKPSIGDLLGVPADGDIPQSAAVLEVRLNGVKDTLRLMVVDGIIGLLPTGQGNANRNPDVEIELNTGTWHSIFSGKSLLADAITNNKAEIRGKAPDRELILAAFVQKAEPGPIFYVPDLRLVLKNSPFFPPGLSLTPPGHGGDPPGLPHDPPGPPHDPPGPPFDPPGPPPIVPPPHASPFKPGPRR